MKKTFLLACTALLGLSVATAQNAMITIDAGKSLGPISPLVYGQFIEYMGKCIDGGIYEEGNPLSDARGFRTDVLEKAKELAPTLLRFPGGTVAKTIHWEDGVGPKEKRRAMKNLIWGGIDNYHFGTCEFIEYCREIGAEPFLVINLATGTPDEAANWVEYCNGTGNTYYANLRRSHGYEEPFNVKYWALGNEEGARSDAGRHQDPQKYVEDVWHFIKLMKLTDPTIELVANGESGDMDWNKTVLDGLGDAVDYLAVHWYSSGDDRPYSLFRRVYDAEKLIVRVGEFLEENYTEEVENWDKWMRFPPRRGRIQIALDEWGIWEEGAPPYGTTNIYDWRCALATAQYLNMIQRNANYIGIANWAQMVNILAPIMADENGSVRQTVFYPLMEYRRRSLGESISATAISPKTEEELPSLDVSATIDREKRRMVLTVVNFNAKDIECPVDYQGVKIDNLAAMTVLTGDSFQAANTLENPGKNVVRTTVGNDIENFDKLTIKGHSVTICEFALK